MSKILVNYAYNKELDLYTILNSGKVFADLPVAVMEDTKEYSSYLIVNVNGALTVVDKKEFLQYNQLEKVVIDEEGRIIKDDNGKLMYLPKNADLENLRFINDTIILITDRKENE